jgi:hypothetical protein
MLEKLKNLKLSGIIDIDEAISLSKYARGLAEEYAELGQVVPEWLEQQTKALREEIGKRTRESDLARLKELEREIEALKTQAERRTDVQRKMAELQERLGMKAARAK